MTRQVFDVRRGAVYNRAITQEKLAERLNITAQAVSKWERGETLPDVTMIVSVASAFGVTTDELLGVNAAANEAKIQAYLDERTRLKNIGRDADAFELICRAYAEFPHDWRVICEYIWGLCHDPAYMDEPWGAGAHYDEITRLCQRVIDECPEPQLRFDALDYLLSAYNWTGKKELAAALCDHFPDSLYRTKQELLLQISDSAEYTARLRGTIHDLAGTLIPKLGYLAHDLPPEKQIAAYKKQIAFIGLIYEDGDYGHDLFYLGRANCETARCLLELADADAAAEYAERGFAFLAQSDEQWRRGEVITHTSAAVAGVTFDPRQTAKSNVENWVAYELKLFGEFEPKITDERLLAVLEKYEPLAGVTE